MKSQDRKPRLLPPRRKNYLSNDHENKYISTPKIENTITPKLGHKTEESLSEINKNALDECSASSRDNRNIPASNIDFNKSIVKMNQKFESNILNIRQ